MRVFILLVFFLVNVLAQAQYKISGVVYQDDKLLVNTEVFLVSDDNEIGTKSNKDGFYQFSNVATGLYKIVVKKDLKEVSESVIVSNEDQIKDIGFSFESDDVLDDLVIKVESVKSKLEKEGFAMNVIETKEAALRNIQTNELLDRTAGVRVRQNGGLGSSVNYNLNGMSGNSVRIFVDGIPISTYGQSFSLNSIPPALIQRIEVYKGVTPIHLSEDALGGAINVVLKNGLQDSFNASISGGSFNTWQGNFNGLTRNKKNGFTIQASSFYNFSDNDYEVWGKFVRNTLPNGRLEQVKAKRFNDAYKSLGGQFEAGFTNVRWADRFMIGVNASDSYREIQHGTYMTKPYMGRFEESNSQVVSLVYKKKDFLLKGLSFDLTAMHSKRHQVVNDTVKWNYNWFGEKNLDLDGNPILSSTGAQQGAATINHSKFKISSLRANLSYEINYNHKFVLNQLYYSLDRNDNDEMKSIIERNFIDQRNFVKKVTGLAYEMKAFDAKLKTNLFSKYYEQEIEKVKPVLKNIDGTQQKVNDYTHRKNDYLGYGIATSYLIKPSIAVLASFERALRLPEQSEVFGDPAENIIENNALRAEISDNANLGFKIGPYKLAKHTISYGMNGFIRDTKDKIVRRSNTRLNDAEQTTPFENLDKTRSKGFDMELHYDFNKRVILFVNASKFNTVFSKKVDEKGNEFGYYNQQVPNEPFFTVSGNLQYVLPNFPTKDATVNLHYGFNMIEPFYTNWLETAYFRTPKQLIQDLGLSYVFPNKHIVISFDAKNIFNKEAYDNFAVQKPGRSFYLKLNYSFNKF